MPAVIVAAGVASRLHPYSRDLPKTLMELEPGLPLIRFILERLRRAGLGPIYIVTRREHAEKLSCEHVIRVLVVDAEEFGNLYTVYTAMKIVKPPFLIAMSDHIFEFELLARLLSHRSDKAFTICLDRTPSALEAQEGLKVRIEDGRIVAVGKRIESRYGIDTGLIIVRERAVDYIEEVIGRLGPRATIGDALDLAAKSGDVDFVDVTGLLWKDVDTPDDLLEARKLYPRIVARERGQAFPELVTKVLVRPISRVLALDVPARSRGKVAVEMAIAELALAVLTLIAAGEALGPLALLPLSYAALLLADARELLIELHGGAAVLRAFSTSASVFFDAALLSVAALQMPATLQKVSLQLALLGLASSAGAEAARRFATTGNRAWILADRALLLFSMALAPITGHCLPALSIWLISGVAALAGIAKPASVAGRARVSPHPQIERHVKPVERCVELVVVNSLKLFAATALLWLARVAVKGVSFSLGAAVLTVEDAVLAAGLIATIYYGYRILVGLQGIVDACAVKLSSLLGITESSAKGIALNVLYLSLAVLALLYAPPILKSAPTLGDYLSTAVAVALLAVALLLFYSLVRELRRTFKGFVALLVGRIASVIEREG